MPILYTTHPQHIQAQAIHYLANHLPDGVILLPQVSLPDIPELDLLLLTDRAVVVTFDDGYVDVLETAYPLLARYEIPATVFVVSGCLGKRFWWDAGEDDAARPLTFSELADLAGSRLIDVGAHSVSHPMLATLSPGEQRAEITTSKETLQASLNVPVHGFSYPHGATSKATREMVERAGYEYACTSHNDTVDSTSDLFRLPRFWPPNWNGKDFERWLRRWL